MRSTLLGILLAVFSSSQIAFAASPYASQFHMAFASTPVGAATWAPLFPSTVKGIKGLSVLNSSTAALDVGVAVAGSAAGTEVSQMVIPAALSSVGAPGAVFYPITVGYGQRISIRANQSAGTAATSGVLDMSLFYN